MQSWLVSGDSATVAEFDYVRSEATNVRQFRRSRLFAGDFSPELAARLIATTRTRFFPNGKLTPLPAPHFSQDDFDKFCRRNHQVSPGLNDVLKLINAPAAWKKATGRDTHIAIVDSGVDGRHAVFPKWKQSGGWSHDGSDPWQDANGHGTMCATIAAASPGRGARLCGVAPEAKLYACKIGFDYSDVIAAYEWLEDRFDENGPPLIVNNSFGIESRTPPQEFGHPITSDHPLCDTIRRMVIRGIPFVFAAGNNHDLTIDKPCSPNTIWAWNSLPEVITVGEVNQSLQVQTYSSRGPGQWAGKVRKPDCVAPCFGWILYGNSYKAADDGWGTSGAAPQVAGLAALLKERKPNASPAAVGNRIKKRCRPLNYPMTCVGSGLIDCSAAVG